MANTVTLSTTVNTDDTAVINDDTTYTSPARADVGVFVNVYKVDAESVKTELTVVEDDADPVAVSSWTFDIDQDGWYLAYYVAIPAYSALTTYAQYDAVRDSSTDTVYRSKTASNTGNALSNTTYWEEITDPASLAANEDTATESANIDQATYNDIIFNYVTKYRGDKAIEAAKEGASATDEPTESSWQFSIADVNYEAAAIAELRQQYAAAERYVRRIDALVGI